MSQLFVSNTLLSDNGSRAIAVGPSGSGTTTGILNHVELENNTNHGLLVSTDTQTINITVNDSVIANNNVDGILTRGRWNAGQRRGPELHNHQ